MSNSISEVCEQLVEIKYRFEENDALLDGVVENEAAEDLFIAIGMAIAYMEGAITLNKIGEKHLRYSLEVLSDLSEEFVDGDE